MKKKILALSLTIALAISAIPVFAISAQGGLSVSSGVVYNETENTYTITTEAFTTGTVTSGTTGTVADPTDILLVIDQSGSMNDPLSGVEGTISQQAVMKEAVTDFIQAVADNDAITPDVQDHRIALVTFEDDGRVHLTNGTTVDTSTYDTQTDNGTAVCGYRTDYNNLISKVDSLDADGATRIDKGMKAAYDVYKQARPEAEKLVIVFSDGVPSDGIGGQVFVELAQTALNAAYKMKNNTYDGGSVGAAEIYTIGTFADADESVYWFRDYKKWGTYIYCSEWDVPFCVNLSDNEKANRFLNYISSNAPSATDFGDGDDSAGTAVIKKNYTCDHQLGYYKTPSSADEIKSIFQSFSEGFETPDITLGTSAEVRTYVSEQFEFPEGFENSSVKVYTSAYNGNETWATRVEDTSLTATYNESTKIVDVTGFNFDNNYVTDTKKADGTYGKKVIVEFTVKASDDFIGGNDVDVTTGDTGVYTDEGPVKKTDPTTTDVTINLPVDVQSQTIYLGNSLNCATLLDIENKINGINNAYVDISYEIYEDLDNDGTVDETDTKVTTVNIADGETTPSYNVKSEITPTDCTNYLVKCIVTPTNSSGVSPSESTDTFTIHVLQPDFTVSDSNVNYGESHNMMDNNISNLAYEASCGCENMPAVSGTVPTLSIEFKDEDGTILSNPLTVEEDIKITAEIIANNVLTGIKKEFNLTIDCYELTITKSVDEDDWATFGQDVIVNIEQDNVITKVVFSKESLDDGTETIVVTGLHTGTVTVTEDTNWSWRCTPTISESSFEMAGDKTVTIQNAVSNKQWFSVKDFIKNVFSAMGGN